MKKEMDASKDMSSMGKYAMEQMKPEKSEEEEKSSDAIFELELKLNNTKAGKGKK